MIDACEDENIDAKNIVQVRDNNDNNDVRKRNAKSIPPINLTLASQALNSDSGNSKIGNGVARSRR